MEGWLKGLITAACVVIIAVGGIYLWNMWSESTARAERVANREEARQELFKRSGGSEDNAQAVRSFCKSLEGRLTIDLKGNEYAANLVHNCRALGYL